jgi:hypothetical protein
MQRTAREGVNNSLGYKVEPRGVSKKGGILLPNPPLSSDQSYMRFSKVATMTN